MNKEEIFKKVAQMADGTVLSFPDRGTWGSAKWRGNFSGWIPASLIYRYNAKSVSEIFAGGGTTSDLCKDLAIPYCGIDLNPEPVRENIIAMDILDESVDLPDAFYSADLQVLHPPYPCINHVQYANGMWKDTKGIRKSPDIYEPVKEELLRLKDKESAYYAISETEIPFPDINKKNETIARLRTFSDAPKCYKISYIIQRFIDGLFQSDK